MEQCLAPAHFYRNHLRGCNLWFWWKAVDFSATTNLVTPILFRAHYAMCWLAGIVDGNLQNMTTCVLESKSYLWQSPTPIFPLNWGPIVETPCCIKVYSQYQSLSLFSLHIVISIALKVCRLHSLMSVLPIELYLTTNTVPLDTAKCEHFGVLWKWPSGFESQKKVTLICLKLYCMTCALHYWSLGRRLLSYSSMCLRCTLHYIWFHYSKNYFKCLSAFYVNVKSGE